MFEKQDTLIIFYSLEGNTKYIAEAISEEFGYDMLELKPVKEIKAKGFSKFFLGGKRALFATKVELMPYEVDFDKYSSIIIGSPIWASRYAPVFNTFFDSNSFTDKKVAIYCSCAGSSGKFYEKMKAQLGSNEVVGFETFYDSDSKRDISIKEKAIEWIRSIVD